MDLEKIFDTINLDFSPAKLRADGYSINVLKLI